MLKKCSFQTWKDLQSDEQFNPDTVDRVKMILRAVKEKKDNAVRSFTTQFDNVTISTFRVTQNEIEEAYNKTDPTLLEDLKIAKENIQKFHEMQLPTDYQLQVGTASYVGQKVIPIPAVGIYVPGGTAAYPSTVLMNAIPAQVAGCKRIVMISPPNREGKISDIILAAAKVAGITEIYKVGGAQGIAALAYGTETIPKVNKIVGPGNIYVALAKREVFGTVGIDMVAGPSEIVIVADKNAKPRYVAADLLSQAEHDTLARPILITTSITLLQEVEDELMRQLEKLPRKAIALTALQTNGYAIIATNLDEAAAIVNEIAPEHLELLVENPLSLMKQITNAGAIFLGEYSPEPLGDYIAGPNHTLPTSGTATFSSALGVEDFIKKTSVISYQKEDLQTYQGSIIRLAKKEGLDAHANAVKVRFENENT